MPGFHFPLILLFLDVWISYLDYCTFFWVVGSIVYVCFFVFAWVVFGYMFRIVSYWFVFFVAFLRWPIHLYCAAHAAFGFSFVFTGNPVSPYGYFAWMLYFYLFYFVLLLRIVMVSFVLICMDCGLQSVRSYIFLFFCSGIPSILGDFVVVFVRIGVL